MTTTEEETKKKVILVTGGNTGIGYALCKQLVLEHDCVVYLGARNVERGTKAVQDIQELANRTGAPEKAQNIHFLLIDVSDDASVQAAAATLKAQLGSSSSSSSLYGLVNNAGVGLKTGSGCENELLATNLYGPKRVTEAFVTMIEQRIVNVSSGAASMYLRDQSSEVKHFFTNPATTWESYGFDMATVRRYGTVRRIRYGHRTVRRYGTVRPTDSIRPPNRSIILLVRKPS